MAVGALQKAGVRMANQICHRLFVHTGVEQGGHEEMPQRVQMRFLRKSNGLIDLPQSFGEGIRVNELPMGIREEIGTEFPMCLQGLHLLPAAVAHKNPVDVG